MEGIFKRLICFSLTVILIFSSSSIVQAKTKLEIERSNIDKIVDDVAEYLTERTVFGKGTPKLKFDLYTKTQMACKISKTYEEGKIKVKFNGDEHEPSSFSILKKKEIQKNAKSLFGSSKIDIPEVKNKEGGGFEDTMRAKEGNQDAFEYDGRILVSDFGGWFRYPDWFPEYIVKVKKISGKSTKTVVIDCGINGYTDGNDLTKRKFSKWGTYTLTLKPTNNKYGCIITKIEENWMNPYNAFQS